MKVTITDQELIQMLWQTGQRIGATIHTGTYNGTDPTQWQRQAFNVLGVTEEMREYDDEHYGKLMEQVFKFRRWSIDLHDVTWGTQLRLCEWKIDKETGAQSVVEIREDYCDHDNGFRNVKERRWL